MKSIHQKLMIFLLLMSVSSLASGAVRCFEDPDGDGFYSPNAKEIQVKNKLHCWWKKGVIKRSSVDRDCSPQDPSVHFQAIELMDGKDNNCDGVADEPRFIYSKDLPIEGTSPAINQLKITINDQRTHSLLTSNKKVFIKLTFTPLNGERRFNVPERRGKLVVTSSMYKAKSRELLIQKNYTSEKLKRFMGHKLKAHFYQK